MAALRTNVAARVVADDSTIRPDLLDPAQTHDELIRMLDVITAPAEKGGHGRKIEVTALHRDHHWDGDLGPHGHAPGPDPEHIRPGWAVDFVLPSDPYLVNHTLVRGVVLELVRENRYCTKVGGPAWIVTDPEIARAAADHGVVVFADPGTGPHLHAQTSEAA